MSQYRSSPEAFGEAMSWSPKRLRAEGGNLLMAAALAVPVPGGRAVAATAAAGRAARAPAVMSVRAGLRKLDAAFQHGYKSATLGLVRMSQKAAPKIAGSGFRAASRRMNRKVKAFGYQVFMNGKWMPAGSYKGFLAIEGVIAGAFVGGEQLWSERKSRQHRRRTGRGRGSRARFGGGL